MGVMGAGVVGDFPTRSIPRPVVEVSIDRGSETEATHSLQIAESHTGHQGDTQRPVQRRIREYIACFRPTALSSYGTRHPATSRTNHIITASRVRTTQYPQHPSTPRH